MARKGKASDQWLRYCTGIVGTEPQGCGQQMRSSSWNLNFKQIRTAFQAIKLRLNFRNCNEIELVIRATKQSTAANFCWRSFSFSISLEVLEWECEWIHANRRTIAGAWRFLLLLFDEKIEIPRPYILMRGRERGRGDKRWELTCELVKRKKKTSEEESTGKIVNRINPEQWIIRK